MNAYIQANFLLEKYPDRREEDKKVTRGWIAGFLSRHTILKREKTQIIDSIRLDACTKLNLRPFYERFNKIKTDNHIIDELVFNLDETCINFSQKYKGRTIVTSDMPPRVTAQPDRAASSTLVLCIPISGKALDSTLIWPQKMCPAEFSSFPVKGVRVQCESISWQTRASFERMMINYYIPEMINRREKLHTPNTPILSYFLMATPHVYHTMLLKNV